MPDASKSTNVERKFDGFIIIFFGLDLSEEPAVEAALDPDKVMTCYINFF